MAKIKVNDVLLECVERGKGEPMVLVHGSASDYRTWQIQQETFGKRYRTIAYSRRYHWPNEQIADGADYSMAEHVDDLEAILRALDVGPVHLVGHSYGAFLCLLLAARAPGLVHDLVLAEPPAITLFVSNVPKPSELLPLFIRRPRTAAAIVGFGARGVGPATSAIERNDLEEALRLFGTITLGPNGFRRLSPPRLDQARANFIKAELTGSGYPPVDEGLVRGVSVPTLLVNGRESPALFHRLADRLEELLPDSSRIQIPDASHIMHEDNPAAYNAAVLSFLENAR